MKKIVNFLILIVVCFLPVVAEAKATLKFEKEFLNELFLYEEDNKSYFFNSLASGFNSSNSLHVFDKDYNLEEKSIILESASLKDIYTYRPYLEVAKFEVYYSEGDRLIQKDNMIYIVDYEFQELYYFNVNDETEGEISFEDDLNLTKNVLGKKYDIFYHYENSDNYVFDIDEFDGYYAVFYRDEDYNYFISIIDEDLNILLNLEYDYFRYRPVVYIYDDLIYVKNTNKKIDIYKLDGTKIQSLNISHDLIDQYDEDYSCEYLDFSSMSIVNNYLYLPYTSTYYGCEERISINDANDFVKGQAGLDTLTLKYSLDFDVDTVESSSGEFTYETKVDEDGRLYVELKVTPKDGYSVEEIIVTDINGERIEVTNNKFYKPANDVKIEVKYVLGEYLPIPDTFLGKSLTVIIIGLILVGLGFYTINYVKGESKVDI